MLCPGFRSAPFFHRRHSHSRDDHASSGDRIAHDFAAAVCTAADEALRRNHLLQRGRIHASLIFPNSPLLVRHRTDKRTRLGSNWGIQSIGDSHVYRRRHSRNPSHRCTNCLPISQILGPLSEALASKEARRNRTNWNRRLRIFPERHVALLGAI